MPGISQPPERLLRLFPQNGSAQHSCMIPYKIHRSSWKFQVRKRVGLFEWVCFRFAGDFLHNSTTNCYLYKLAVCLRSGILSPGGATEVRQVQACDSTRSACSHKKRTGTHGMGDRRRCNFFKPRFLPPSHYVRGSGHFFAYPGVWGFASSILSLATPSQAAASQLHPGLPAVALRAQ